VRGLLPLLALHYEFQVRRLTPAASCAPARPWRLWAKFPRRGSFERGSPCWPQSSPEGSSEGTPTSGLAFERASPCSPGRAGRWPRGHDHVRLSYRSSPAWSRLGTRRDDMTPTSVGATSETRPGVLHWGHWS